MPWTAWRILVKLDLGAVRNVLAHVEQLLAAHDGEQVPGAQIGAAVRHSDRLHTLQSDLRAAQEFLRLADAEIATASLMSAGRTDPRHAPAPRWRHQTATLADTNRRAGTAPAHTRRPAIRVPDQSVVQL
jgi:hypothetical protein